jgi:lipopolysaccharide/colanic/teichoic acid biosynthesis glycosyltransferase
MANRNIKSSTSEIKPAPNPSTKAGSIATREINRVEEDTFHTMLALERRRAERSRKPFVLILLDAHALFQNGSGSRLLEQLTSAVHGASRETDLIGWYKKGAILGVIFTEVSLSEKHPITQVLLTKVVKALHERVDRQHASKVVITAHLFPENLNREGSDSGADVSLYPDLTRQGPRKRAPLIAKRALDMTGSGILLLVLSPIFALIAVAIKLTSAGPVFFAQERLGQFGTRFKCLKFRTMYTNNDPKIHREYVERFIAGKAKEERNESGSVVYKIMDDPRITPVGRLLRKLSFDELPQFWNVLQGEMSLVGPRPPVAYEFRVYDIWHRRRVLEVKPGVTGLWQVSGRSRTSFDDMVRLDLRYSQSWSFWLDLKILAATPRAVLTGDGAY